MPGRLRVRISSALLDDYAFGSLPDAEKFKAIYNAIHGAATPASPFISVVDSRMQGKEWRDLRGKVFARDGYRCVYCGSGKRLECDHVIPHCRGGSDDPSNLVTACRKCNRQKFNKTPQEWKGGN